MKNVFFLLVATTFLFGMIHPAHGQQSKQDQAREEAKKRQRSEALKAEEATKRRIREEQAREEAKKRQRSEALKAEEATKKRIREKNKP